MIRVTGMNSGLDTDSIIRELVAANSKKKEKLEKTQTKMEWKQDAWTELNKKIKKFYSSTLSNLRFQGSYKKKKTTSSNNSVATVTAGDNAVNGSQTLVVKSLAKAGYLTGGKLSANGKKTSSSTKISDLTTKTDASGNTTTGVSASDTASFTVKSKGKEKQIDITGATTISQVVSKLNDAGVTASYDSTNQRIFISSAASGAANDFSITANNMAGLNALSGLGLLTNEDMGKSAAANADLAAAYNPATGALLDNNNSFVTAKAASYASSLKGSTKLSSVQAAYDKIASLTSAWETDKKEAYENAAGTIAAYDNDPAKIAERQTAIKKEKAELTAQKDYAELLKKKEDGSITEAEQKKLDAFETSKTEKTEYEELKAKKEALAEGEILTEDEEKRLNELSGKTFYDLSSIDENTDVASIDANIEALDAEAEDLTKATAAMNDYNSYKAAVAAQESGIQAAVKNAAILNDYYASANADMLAGISGDSYAEKLTAIGEQISEAAARGEDTSALEKNQKLLQTMADNEAIVNGQNYSVYTVDAATGALNADPEEVNPATAEAKSYDADTQGIQNRAIKTVTAEAQAAYEVATNAEKYVSTGESGAVRVAGQDAEILLNGASFTSSNNAFTINGLTITAKSESAITGKDENGNNVYQTTSITTEDDTDGIYNMIKDFFKSYNELIKEIDSLYGAESADKYQPLTDEEKEAMSDDEIEKWEEKIKSSLLRHDSDLGTVQSLLKSSLSQGITIGGQKLSLASFGIETAGYFDSGDFEKGIYHIAGDKDDDYSGAYSDQLKKAIATNPDQVADFFSQLTNNLYKSLRTLSTSTTTRSYGNYYDDKAMKDQLRDYKSKISKEEARVNSMEDRYYKQFAAMEAALSKINSTSNYIGGMMGTN